MAHHRSSRGIVLIEVVVSMAILSMMVLSVWSGFQGTIQASELADRVQDRYRGVRIALNRMASEIPLAYLSYNRPPDEDRHFTLFEGQKSTGSSILTFSSFAHKRMRKDSNESDQSVIQYFVADDPEDSSKKNLYRRETRRLTGDLPEELERFAPAYILCENVKSLDLYFWDVAEEEWREDWSTVRSDEQADRLPTRVKIVLTVPSEDEEVSEPLIFTTQTKLFMQEKLDGTRS